ncbi:glycoside hydrolase domain-containing protein [Amycolatopsis sp. NPDC004772]
MATALDYSAGRPSADAVVKAGHSGVIRYIGTPGRTKNITKTEYADMTAKGVGVALVYENHAGDAAGGFAAGQTAARLARADADSIGFPSDRPIYFAVDSDQVTAANFAAVSAYLDGAASVLGSIDRVGVYGEYDVIEKNVGPHARYGWQTAAWSGGKRSSKAALFQRLGQIYVGGIQSDVNDILAADWGQHDAQEDDLPSAQEVADAVWNKAVQNALDGGWSSASDLLRFGHFEAGRGRRELNPKVDNVGKALTDLALKVAAQQSVPVVDLVAGVVAGLSPVVTAALADVEGLDEDAVASKLAANLAARLVA